MTGSYYIEKENAGEFFKCILCDALTTTREVPSCLILFKRRQTSLQQMSPKLGNSEQYRWINCTTGKRKNMDFSFWGELSLNNDNIKYLQVHSLSS